MFDLVEINHGLTGHGITKHGHLEKTAAGNGSMEVSQ